MGACEPPSTLIRVALAMQWSPVTIQENPVRNNTRLQVMTVATYVNTNDHGNPHAPNSWAHQEPVSCSQPPRQAKADFMKDARAEPSTAKDVRVRVTCQVRS